MKNHFLSALAVGFFLFIAFGSDETDKSKSDNSTVNNQQTNSDASQQNTEQPPAEAPTTVVLNTDSILQLHIEWLKQGVKLTREKLKTTDIDEQNRIYAEKDKLRENSQGDFSNIKDVAFFQKTFINAFNSCTSIAEQISSSENESEIDSLITEALISQTLCWDALLYIQNPDLNYPREKSKTLSNCYKTISGVFADERILKLPISDFKSAVSTELPNIQQSNQLLSNF
jgi:hypothetical protein